MQSIFSRKVTPMQFNIHLIILNFDLSLPFLEGRSVSDSVNNIKERLLPVLKANWMLWPIAQASILLFTTDRVN